VIESSVLIVRRIAYQLEVLRNAITEHDQSISALARSHPDYAIFPSFPEEGPAMAPRLIAAFETQRDRYATACAIQCLAGIAPVTESSGKQKWVHWRWAWKSCARPFTNGLGCLPENRSGPEAFPREKHRRVQQNG
jgi:hypothetical protein